MAKHARGGSSDGASLQQDRSRHAELVELYDATALVGLRTMVCNAAIRRKDKDGETSIELPKLASLLASAAVARCLMPIRLRGSEMRAMRKIMGLTLAELAHRLDEKTAAETISRWENESQPMGGYAEKILRLLICEDLRDQAQGIDYHASIISRLRVVDPWRQNPDYEVPAIELSLVKLKEQSGSIIETWDQQQMAA